jgi:hypothetical protein
VTIAPAPNSWRAFLVVLFLVVLASVVLSVDVPSLDMPALDVPLLVEPSWSTNLIVLSSTDTTSAALASIATYIRQTCLPGRLS